MEDPNSYDGLPPGWTVEVRVRKNGKRDKVIEYYISPSSGVKFNSKVEVFRHLDNAQNKASIQRSSHNVVVEKGIAEGLPPGWMKKTRITTKGDKIRRDPYYIDPVRGYAFRSKKGVEHYLKSGEIGRSRAFKPKDQDDSDIELKANKFSSAGVSTKPTSSVSMSQSLDFDMIVNDQQVPRPASLGKYTPMPISEHISSRCVLGAELTSSVLSRDEISDQKEGKDGLTGSTLVPGCTDEDAQENPVQENAETKHGTEKSQTRNPKRKYKKEINLPRRASKRLAGIKVDPVPELKTRNRPRRAAVKQSVEEETIINADKSPNILPNDLAKQCNVLGDESGNGNKVDAMFDYNLDIPLREMLKDPCIAFAIQTLTGVTFETSKNSEISFETLAAAEGDGKKTNGLNDDKEICNVFSSPENYAIPQQEAGVAKNDDKANENAGSYSGKTLGISWMDPCFEFAIKTPTGTVPLDSDQNPKNCLQQQLSSSNTQHSDMTLSSDYYCNQYFGTQNPMFKKSFVDPTMQHTRNVGMGNSAGARPQQQLSSSNTQHSDMALSSDYYCNQYFGTQNPMFKKSFVDPTMQHTRNVGMGNSAGARLQQQLSSSNIQNSDMALSSDYYCNQYFGTQNPMFKKSFGDPTMQHTRNVGMGDSAGARLPHCGEDRRNVCKEISNQLFP